MDDDDSSNEYKNFYYLYQHKAGKNYFWNIATHETTWTLPNGAIVVDPDTKKRVDIEQPNQNSKETDYAHSSTSKFKRRDDDRDTKSEKSDDLKILVKCSRNSVRKIKTTTDDQKPKGCSLPATKFYIPDRLEEDSSLSLSQFNLPKLFDRIFMRHKKSSAQNSNDFQSKPINVSLLDLSSSDDKKATKNAYPLFKSILKYTGVRESKECEGTALSIVKMVEKSASHNAKMSNSPHELRNSPFVNVDSSISIKYNLVDEAYVQLMKQTTNCPKEYMIKGLELINIIICCFIPSDPSISRAMLSHLAYIATSVSENSKNNCHPDSPDMIIKDQAIWCYIQLFDRLHYNSSLFDNSSPPPANQFQFITPNYIRTIPEQINLVHKVFDVSLNELMFYQHSAHPTIPIPYILHVFTEILFALKCEKCVGIFRIPGNLTKIEEFISRINKGETEFLRNEDVADVSSLFKLWIRRITGSIINAEMMEELLNLRTQEEFLDFAKNLDNVNQRTLMYLVGFLRKLSLSSHITNMDVDNLAMVFGPNIIFAPGEDPQYHQKISGKSHRFLVTLISKWDVSSVYPLQHS